MGIFKDWEVKKSIVSPLLVNLLTAFIVFLIAVTLKEQIYKWLKPLPKAEEFPLFCVAETYNNENRKVVGDFFIMNLTKEDYTEEELKNFLQLNISDQDLPIKQHIRIRWKNDRGEDRIYNILQDGEDIAFNEGKGKVEIIEPKNKMKGEEWIIKVEQIGPKAILRLTILTDYERGASRGAKPSIPFEYSYPREPEF